LIDPKAFKLQFLAGDKDAVMYTDPNEPKASFYQTTLKGLQVPEHIRVSILDNQRTSYV